MYENSCKNLPNHAPFPLIKKNPRYDGKFDAQMKT